MVGDGPTYVSFDIDSLDPAYAPGTGTPEVGGLTTLEAQLMIRGLRGLNLVGADVVEVSPPFDPSGITALAGASMMFELLCVLADSLAQRRCAAASAKLGGRLPVKIGESGMEAAQASEAGTVCDLGDLQVGLVQQALGALQAQRLGGLARARADMALEQPRQVARADAEALRQRVDAPVVEHPVLDQPERARDGGPGAVPGRAERRGLRPAAQAWPVAVALGRRGARPPRRSGSSGRSGSAAASRDRPGGNRSASWPRR